jgi:purine-cytosine permease-like protein
MKNKLSKRTIAFILANLITVLTISSNNTFFALFNASVIWIDIILIPMMIVLLFDFFLEEGYEKISK